MSALRPSLPPVLRRALLFTVGGALALTALVGLAHTRPARPLLGWLGRVAGPRASCPLGHAAATPAEREARRRRFAAQHKGQHDAAARPALGLALERMRRADIAAWAVAHGVSCRPKRDELECGPVPASALPAGSGEAPVRTLWLRFGGDEQLVSVVALRRDPSAQPIAQSFAALRALLDGSAGPAAALSGDPSPAGLGAGLLRQASAEYRCRDYYAILRATNMGDGYVLTEEYHALPR